MTGFLAVVLADSRPGKGDAVAAYAGVSHKALIELEGRTLLARVVGALDAAGAARIAVCTNRPEVIAATQALSGRAAIERIAASQSPAASVLSAGEALGTPLLVTTADHALLRPEWVLRFLADAPQDVDIALLLAPEAAVTAAAPDAQRTWLRFSDGRFSGCNLFLLRTPRALEAVRFWRRMEAHRKHPWRIAWRIGPVTLVGYAFRWLSLDGMIARIATRAGVTAAAVRTPFGLAAVDVDKPADLDLVRKLVG